MSRFSRFTEIRVRILTWEEHRRRKSGGENLVEGRLAKTGVWQEISNHKDIEDAVTTCVRVQKKMETQKQRDADALAKEGRPRICKYSNSFRTKIPVGRDKNPASVLGIAFEEVAK